MVTSQEDVDDARAVDDAIKLSIVYTFGYASSTSATTPLYQAHSLPAEQAFVGFDCGDLSPNTCHPFWLDPTWATGFAPEFEYYSPSLTTVNCGEYHTPVLQMCECINCIEHF